MHISVKKCVSWTLHKYRSINALICNWQTLFVSHYRESSNTHVSVLALTDMKLRKPNPFPKQFALLSLLTLIMEKIMMANGTTIICLLCQFEEKIYVLKMHHLYKFVYLFDISSGRAFEAATWWIESKKWIEAMVVRMPLFTQPALNRDLDFLKPNCPNNCKLYKHNIIYSSMPAWCL